MHDCKLPGPFKSYLYVLLVFELSTAEFIRLQPACLYHFSGVLLLENLSEASISFCRILVVLNVHDMYFFLSDSLSKYF